MDYSVGLLHSYAPRGLAGPHAAVAVETAAGVGGFAVPMLALSLAHDAAVAVAPAGAPAAPFVVAPVAVVSGVAGEMVEVRVEVRGVEEGHEGGLWRHRL